MSLKSIKEYDMIFSKVTEHKIRDFGGTDKGKLE
jgi:hypothetical protein